MKIKKNRITLLTLAVGAILTACGGGGTSEQAAYRVTGPYMTGSEAKPVYNAVLGSKLATLNTATTSIGSDAQHIANFVDGLVENNEFGQLKLALAESAEVNEENTVFKFGIRGKTNEADAIPWLRYGGDQYAATVNGVTTPQFVTAADFVHALKLNLDFANNSTTSYITAMFIKNATEYLYFTQIKYAIANGQMAFGKNWKTHPGTPANIAATLNGALNAEGIESNLKATDIKSVQDFERVGVKATGKYEVEYTLERPADYFPTVLTYTAFLPINEVFVKEVGLGVSGFGTSNDNFLYNGAFLLTKSSETGLTYTKNKKYYDAESVHFDTVNYIYYEDNSKTDDLRTLYERGDIDGFGVNDKDTVGWDIYVTGPDGSGTIDNPAHDDTYSRYIESIDFNFHYMLNLNRDLSQFDNADKKYSPLTKEEAANFNRAVQISSVRDVVLNSYDQQVYNREKNGEYGSSQQTQTFSMKGFVNDAKNNRDYIEYLYDEYAKTSGLPVEEVREHLKPGQDVLNNVTNFTQEALNEKIDAALADIEIYNNDIAKTGGEKIKLPVVFEMTNGSYDTTAYSEDRIVVTDTNKRLNKGVSAGSFSDNYANAQYFKALIPSADHIKSGNDYLITSDRAYYNMHIMGWAPDYGDPLTYLNTYTTNGEMASFTNSSTYKDEEGHSIPVPGYHNENGKLVEDTFVDSNGVEHTGILSKYDALVNEAKNQTADPALRYQLFAEAEAHLLYELHLIRPIYNRGLGWAVTVSKTIGYETPTSSYGLSSDKLKGIWVLKNTVGAEKRRELKIQYDNAKANAVTVPIYEQ